MSRVAAVRLARRSGGHQTRVEYIWTGHGIQFHFSAMCSACGLLVDSSDERISWAAAQHHHAGHPLVPIGSGL